jgi:rhodanese-related sulfurtransferase
MIRRLGLIAVGCLLLIAASAWVWAVQRGEGELEHTKDSLQTVKELVEAKKAVLVDVRDLVEWNDGHVDVAVHLPWRDLQDKLTEEQVREKVPKDKIIYTHCAVGYRSLKAGKILLKYGYDIRPLKPGFDELVKAGFKSVSEKK